MTSGKTLVTSEGTKIVPILKAQVVKSTGANTTQGTSVSTTSPQYTTTKVVPGGKSLTRVKCEDQQVSGVNAHGLAARPEKGALDPLEPPPLDIRDWLPMRLTLWIVTQN